MKRAGFVLVGGNSSRMGRDKALLPEGGRTLAEHIASAVREAAGIVTLIGPPERYGSLGIPVVADAVPSCGPAGGILTALSISGADWSLVVACDMPALTASFLRGLMLKAETSGGHCLVPLSPSGKPEPLCAVYHREALPGLRKAVEAGQRKVADILAGLDTQYWPVAESVWFRNLNTPEEWAIHQGTPGPAGSTTGQSHV